MFAISLFYVVTAKLFLADLEALGDPPDDAKLNMLTARYSAASNLWLADMTKNTANWDVIVQTPEQRKAYVESMTSLFQQTLKLFNGIFP